MNHNHPALRWLMIATVLAAASCSSDDNPDAGGGARDAAFPAPVPDDCLTDVSAGQHSFACEGINIEVSVPDACIESACGIVFDIHGKHMTAADEEAHTNMRALGKEHGYIVVQPTAPSLQNNQPYWQDADVDDLHRILRRVEQAWHADLKRIHFTGFSQGGYVTWLFLCKYGYELAAVAPAAGAGPCTPPDQADVLALVGRRDPLVTPQMAADFRDDLVAAWELGPASRVAGDNQYTRDRYSNAEGTVVELIDHDYITDPAGAFAANEGHCYPGSTASSGSSFDEAKCQPPNAFHWGEEVIKFFVAHPRQTEPDLTRDGGVDGPDAATPDAGTPDTGPPSPATWVDIPAGTFTMGSTTSEPCREPAVYNGVREENEDQHQVILTRGFAIQTTEVTQHQFERLMGYNPSYFLACGINCPVEKVSWDEAVAYCNALSAEGGHAPCYDCSGSGEDVTCAETATYSGAGIYTCPGYRLPTDAEWEHAYRAGTTTAFYSGPNDEAACGDLLCIRTDANADGIAWYGVNSTVAYAGCDPFGDCGCRGTHPVGQKQANAWGLYDMAGNVYEWCNDGYQESLGTSTVTDPWGSSSGTRLVRGGTWHTPPEWLRAAMRLKAGSGHDGGRNTGFRCVRGL